MSGPDSGEGMLQMECRVFTRYLVGEPPDARVQAAYCDAHARRRELQASSDFDRMLMAVARRGPLAARIADAGCRILAPSAQLRDKLVLLLAILETSPGPAAVIDEPGGRVGWPLRLLLQGILAVLLLLAGGLLVLPLRLACSRERRPV